ncbi:glycosyltransferase family 39 protein [Nocardia sp. CA2R105]|uniref:glycosyltransferase family 39 protein n=1 Tax=Nocardia coffeae TaxID=2873381 RepID=UPI001CA75F98|nr:glycosyltransferase family 39 protein [Nocardia coffeae]MBY8856683.1 glycosyltransferase family 39 protein [Nocardia coffeae]
MTAISDRADQGDQLAAEQDPDTTEVRLAGLGLAAVAVLTGVILLMRSGRYGYFGDELYFVAAGNHPAPGYADQGPLIPLLARTAWTLMPGSVVALRIPSILAAVAGVLLAGAFAREMGGRRRAQILAAAAYATCPYLITQAATLSTFALDSALSAAALWLLARWIRLRRDRLLPAAAAVIAVDLEVKLLVVVLLAGIVAGVAVAGPRELLRRPALWWCVPVVTLTALPGMLWQQRHGRPQLAMGAVIRTEQHAATGGVLGLPVQWAVLTGLLGGLLALLGWWVLLRHSTFRDHRWIGIAAIVEVMFVILSGGRPYYVAGLFPALFAAGAVAILDVPHRAAQLTGRMVSSKVRHPAAPTAGVTAFPNVRHHAARLTGFVMSTDTGDPAERMAGVMALLNVRHRAAGLAGAVVPLSIRRRAVRIVGIAVVAVSVAISLTEVTVLPLLLARIDRPVHSQAELSTRMRTFGTTGWERLVAGVDAAYRALPSGDRAGVVILTRTYWQAAALDVLGPPGHPPVYSADRGYAYFGRPPDATPTVLYLGTGSSDSLPHNAFEVAEPVARIDDPLGFPGIDRGVTVWRCQRPRQPWPALWPRLTTLVLDPGL